LYLKYLQIEQKSLNIDLKLNLLKRIYILDIICISEDYIDIVSELIDNLLEKYDKIFTKWISIDNNNKYLSL
jgi:hypothetical protein